MSRRLLLVGWEAADWKILQPLLDAGKLPALQSLVRNGASGSLLSGLPLASAPQWTSLVTGKRPWQHGVCHQVEWERPNEAPAVVSARHRRALALWEMLAARGRRSLVVGWPASHGTRGSHLRLASNRYAEPTAGPGIKPWPPAPLGTYWPEPLGNRLDGLRASPEHIQADLLQRYVPDWLKVDQRRDPRLGHLRVFLAADLSHHAALMHLLQNSDWDLAAIHYPALGAISAMFLPYLAPQKNWISETDFQLYRAVVPAACILLDRLLHSLLQSVGSETAVVVVSAHGVNPQLPPQYPRGETRDLWKTPYGILAACGPGFATDTRVLGATIHDVAPTLLSWLGLPMGEDMEGRVLMESFAEAPTVQRIASWEPPAAPAAPTPGPTPAPGSTAQRQLRREWDWNLAQSYMDGARYSEAAGLLVELFRSFPERGDFGHALFQCQLTLKQHPEAAETLTVLLDAIPPGIASLLLRAELQTAQGQWLEARRLVEEIQTLRPAEPDALRRLGMLLWRLRQWKDLAALAREALQRNENEPLAWLALAEASFRLREPAQAVEAATRAIALNYLLPQAHLVLARALLAQGKWPEAREAMQTVLRLQPNHRAATTYLRRTDRTPGNG